MFAGTRGKDGRVPVLFAELEARASEIEQEHKRREAEEREAAERAYKEAKAKARAEFAEAVAGRDLKIAALATSFDDAWDKIDATVKPANGTAYEEAITLIEELRELAERAAKRKEFAARLQDFRHRHARKKKLIAMLSKKPS